MTAQDKRVRVTQVRSQIGFDRRQRATLRGLGIRRMHQTVELEDTPQVRGMIRKVEHLVKVEE
jgi:large subunit ribosomal protein L30